MASNIFTGPTERPPKPKPLNPIQTAITSWLDQLPRDFLDSINLKLSNLVSSAPKRWVVYPPMVLLPSGSFEGSFWDSLKVYTDVPQQMRSLWELILWHISKKEGKGQLTHLAINSGIPLHQSTNDENILRTPSGLIMLCGDFGPALSPDHTPSGQDFSDAFWVSTKQNGIVQIWAPRYTMFSRGNIKEKARLLDFHKQGGGGSNRMSIKDVQDAMAVDLYAGIGYFVFSFAKLGMRVFGWELNPWSVEGLRRGAVTNGWSVMIVRPGEDFKLGDEKIVVFLENNREALSRREELGLKGSRDVKHINCGLLPFSNDSWRTAMEFLGSEGWIHIHENVGVYDIQSRKLEILNIFQKWLSDMGDERVAELEHVELVKTFAPGVWHCVFDLFMSIP
jgi:tRNA wybutosine-synthesizing protein 2